MGRLLNGRLATLLPGLREPEMLGHLVVRGQPVGKRRPLSSPGVRRAGGASRSLEQHRALVAAELRLGQSGLRRWRHHAPARRCPGPRRRFGRPVNELDCGATGREPSRIKQRHGTRDVTALSVDDGIGTDLLAHSGQPSRSGKIGVVDHPTQLPLAMAELLDDPVASLDVAAIDRCATIRAAAEYQVNKSMF